MRTGCWFLKFPHSLGVLTSALSWAEVGSAEGEEVAMGGQERGIQARGAKWVLGIVHVQRPGGGAGGGKFDQEGGSQKPGEHWFSV